MPSSSVRPRLDDYLTPFRKDFRRKDRATWARVYIEGLLGAGGRKTIEGIARRVALPPDIGAEDTRQALQNFVQESPWEEHKVWRRYRRWVCHLTRGDGALVVDDITLVKQGRHSVGVHRQLSTEQGKKVNCQIIPAVFLVTEHFAAPLTMRLYLPHAWQADPGRLETSKVPVEFRRACPRFQVALDLLALLQAEALSPTRVLAGESYRRHDGFRDGVRQLGFALLDSSDRDDHTAAPLLARVEHLVGRLKDRFGMDHFEGRSWRGLHHHLCLVALAHGFTLSCELSAAPAYRAVP